MRRIALACALLLCVVGCKPNPTYNGSVTIEKTDGKVTKAIVRLPNSGSRDRPEFEIQDRETMSKLISGLDSLLIDLKSARDQMPVVEPPLPKEKGP